MKYLNFLWYEIKRTFKISIIRYKVQFITLFIVFLMIFLGLFLGLNNYGPENWAENGAVGYILGFMLWIYTMAGLSDPSEIVGSLRSRGILERLYLGDFSFKSVLTAKVIASILQESVMVWGIGFLGYLIIRPELNFILILQSLLIFIPTIIGIYGIGIMMAGLVLKVKQIGQLSQIISFGLLFISGIMVPSSKIPKVFVHISEFFTLGQGVKLINYLLDKKTFINVFISFDYLILWILAIFWIFIGYTVFFKIEKSAKKTGNLVGY